MANDATFWALVLSGGDGTRLQGLTRLLTGAPIPQQYCRILGERSLLESTLDRLAPIVPRDRTLVVVTRAHLDLACPQVACLPAASLLVQPSNRDTGPGILTSLLALARRDPAATVGIFPSDHHILDHDAFRRHVRQMEAVVRRHPDRIVLLGVRPEHADTGYGYVVPGRRIAGTPGSVRRVHAFHEKPGPALAARLVRRGGLWNSFVMVARAERLLVLLAEVVPAAHASLAALPVGRGALAQAYEAMPSWNFSRDFLQRVAGELLVARGEGLGWSDWGTPEAIERTLRSLDLPVPWRRATATSASASKVA